METIFVDPEKAEDLLTLVVGRYRLEVMRVGRLNVARWIAPNGEFVEIQVGEA